MLKKIITIGTIGAIACSGALTACSADEYQAMVSERVNEYKECVELGNYKGLDVSKIEKSDASLIEENTESVVKNLYESDLEEVNDVSKEGDSITIDAVGYVGDEEFENLSDFEYEIGSGTLIDGFDEQLTGKKKNEQFDITVTFPEDYGDEKVNGKEAVFKTTVKSIKRATASELNDEWVKNKASYLKERGYEGATLDELKANIRQQLEKEATEDYNSRIASEVIEQVVETSTYKSFPEKETKVYVDNIISNIKQEFEEYGTEYSDFNTFLTDAYELESEEALNTYAEEQAQEYLKTKMAVTLIAAENNVTVTSEEIKEFGDKMSAVYGFDSYEAMLKEYKDEVKEDFTYQVLWKKTAAYLASVSNPVKETGAVEELDLESLLTEEDTMESEPSEENQENNDKEVDESETETEEAAE